MGGGGKDEESVTCWWGGEKSKVDREGCRGLLVLVEEEAAWRAVRGARSASMSKPGKSIALVKRRGVVAVDASGEVGCGEGWFEWD